MQQWFLCMKTLLTLKFFCMVQNMINVKSSEPISNDLFLFFGIVKDEVMRTATRN